MATSLQELARLAVKARRMSYSHYSHYQEIGRASCRERV